MDTALLIARLLLAFVFVVAGAAKLIDGAGSRRAIIDFGLPTALAIPLGILLPLAELIVAGALITTASAWWGAVGALALLLLFVGGISLNLARGRKPDCHCFGQLYSAPAGWSTLARNGLLAAVAGFLVWQGRHGAGPSALSWLGALSTAQFVGLIGGLVVLGILAAQWWFLIHLLTQNGRLLGRLEALEGSIAAGGTAPSQNGIGMAAGLPVGAQAPDFSLLGLYGETITLEALRALGKPIMLHFTDPNCGGCMALLPEIGRWQREHADKVSIALVSRGTPEENQAKPAEHGVTGVLLQDEWEVGNTYQATKVPSAVLILPDGTIGSQLVVGPEDIQALVRRAVEAPAQLPMYPAAQKEPCSDCGKVHPNGHAAQVMPARPKLGDPCPEVKLEDLEGNTVELADFKGSETLVLFWNPGCGFCQQMLSDIKEWETNSPEDAPKLLVVSAGSEEANKEMGLTSPVLLDQQFAVGRAFGASGTPSAVLVDAEGKVASDVAVGALAVLELARGNRTAA